MKKLKILVSIDSGANPDLFAELMKTPARSRAGRIRAIATVGIAQYKNVVDVQAENTSKDLPESAKGSFQIDPDRAELPGAMQMQANEEQSREVENEEKMKELTDRRNRMLQKLAKSLERL